MSRPAATLPIRPDADAGVSHIHHVGHVVRDIGAAISLYRRMGFVVPPPSFPVLPLRPGEPAHAFGAGNTHLSFNRSFVELVTVVDVHTTGDALADATLVPLQAPAEALDQLRESIAQTAARISTALARFEGLHILVFGTADVDATVARLEAEGVAHGAVNRVLRPGEGGTRQVSIGYVEIDSDSGRSPEGRLALAEDGPTDSPSLIGHSAHPNGAVQLVESVLCVPDVDLRGYERRYSSYLQRPARSNGPLHIFDLDTSEIMIVPASALETVLPGEVPPSLPAFVAYGVAVHDLASTRDVLERAQFPVRTLPSGGLYVTAVAALGAALIFRPAQ